MNLSSSGVYFLEREAIGVHPSEVGPAWPQLQIVVGVSRAVSSELLQGHSSRRLQINAAGETPDRQSHRSKLAR